jgi:hypothetical protein
MFTKTAIALAIVVGSVSGALAATKKQTSQPARQAQTAKHAQQGFFYCSPDGRYCGGAEYWETFRYTDE